MSGFGEAAAVIGLANTSIHRIHQGFILLSSVRSFGADADKFRRDLEYEFFRFFMWEEDHESARLKTVSDHAEDPYAPVRDTIIHELQSILPKGEKFEERYKLKFEDTEEEVENGLGRGWVKLPSALQRKFETMTAEVIHSRNSTLKKLRFALFDKDSMMKLVQDVHILINRLMEMTSLENQRFILSVLTSMIRRGIKSSSDADDLDFHTQLSLTDNRPDRRWTMHDTWTLGGLKSCRIACGVDATSPEKAQQAQFRNFIEGRKQRSEKLVELRRKSADFETRNGWQSGASRELAMDTRRSTWVLFERRHVGMPSKKSEADRRRHQTENLAILLNELKSSTLHSLQCSGFYWDDGDIVLIYNLPLQPGSPHVAVDPGRPPNIVSLNAVVSDHNLPKANPAIRLRIACTLAEVVLHLHTAGLLHKQIRTDNILLTDFSKSRWPEGQSFQGPYLVGYGYARQNDPRDISDEIPGDPDLRIYSHPMATGQAQQDRHMFRPRFDVYSLGMVLIEIALWRPLKQIVPEIFDIVKRRQNFESSDVLNHLAKGSKRDSVMAEIESSMDSGFAKAIRWCLDPEAFLLSVVPVQQELDVDECFENSISLQEAVFTSLQGSNVGNR